MTTVTLVDNHPWQELTEVAVNAPNPGDKYLYYNSNTKALDVRIPITAETSYPVRFVIDRQNYPQGYIQQYNDGRYEYVIPGYMTNVESNNGNIDISGRQLPVISLAISPVFDIAYSAATALRRSTPAYRHGSITGTPTPMELTLNDGQISSTIDLTVDTTTADFYDLQGRRTQAPAAHGIYIRHQGSTNTTVIVK